MADFRAALAALRIFTINSRVVVDCIDSLVALAEHNRVHLKWVLEHQGIEGNITADLLAKEGASERPIGAEPSCGLSHRSAERVNKELLRIKHCSLWRDTPWLRRMFIGGPSEQRAKEFLQLGKQQLRRALKLFTGYCTLMKHLTNMGLANDPVCRMMERRTKLLST